MRYVLALGQQYSHPVPWLKGAEADPVPCSWQFGAKGDSAIYSKFKFITCFVHGLKITFISNNVELLTMDNRE